MHATRERDSHVLTHTSSYVRKSVSTMSCFKTAGWRKFRWIIHDFAKYPVEAVESNIIVGNRDAELLIRFLGAILLLETWNFLLKNKPLISSGLEFLFCAPWGADWGRLTDWVCFFVHTRPQNKKKISLHFLKKIDRTLFCLPSIYCILEREIKAYLHCRWYVVLK